MPTTEAKFKISADDKDLKKLAQTIPQAFDKKVIQDFQVTEYCRLLSMKMIPHG